MKCAWCGDPLRTQKIIGRKNETLWFTDNQNTIQLYENTKIKEFCTTGCRHQYYFGI